MLTLCCVAAWRLQSMRAATQPRGGLAGRARRRDRLAALGFLPTSLHAFNCSAPLRLDSQALALDAPQLTQGVRTRHAGHLLRRPHLLLRRVRAESSGTATAPAVDALAT